MASLVGSVFEEYSTLTEGDQDKAVNRIGSTVSYINSFVVGSSDVEGTSGNDLYFMDENSTGAIDEDSDGGEDIVVSSTDVTLPNQIESLILTGAEDLDASGNALDNVIAGNAGNNVIDGKQGDDLILGGAGNDLLNGSQGEDTIIGGQGKDTINGGQGADTLEGNGGDDVIDGDNGRDLIFGGSGYDSLVGGVGDDTIYGGTQGDTLIGGSGEDMLYGEAGNDIIDGGSGKDTIVGGLGDDTLTGGTGNDTFYFGIAGNDNSETVITDFKPGNDIIQVEAGLDTAASIVASAVDDGDGNAVVQIGDETVVLKNIDADDVDNSFFFIS